MKTDLESWCTALISCKSLRLAEALHRELLFAGHSRQPARGKVGTSHVPSKYIPFRSHYQPTRDQTILFVSTAQEATPPHKATLPQLSSRMNDMSHFLFPPSLTARAQTSPFGEEVGITGKGRSVNGGGESMLEQPQRGRARGGGEGIRGEGGTRLHR